MSHFLVTALIPPSFAECSPEEIEEELSLLLAPFDENKEVPSYQKSCWCVNSTASAAGREAAETIKPLDDYRKEFFADPANSDFPWAEEVDARWRAFIVPYLQCEEEATHAHPLYQKPSPTCETCRGTGIQTTQIQPRN